jgi:transcriptional regulator with XRE-family HTH domain/predicted RNase H-like HicB family nuclease
MRFYALISTAGESRVAEFPDLPDCVAIAGPAENIGRNAAAVLRARLESLLLNGATPPLPSSTVPRRESARARGIEVPPLLALRLWTRQARSQRGLTAAEFAEPLSLSEAEIRELEHPAGEPSERTIVRVTRELGLPYVPPSRREDAPRPQQRDLFPAPQRGAISRPPEMVSGYDVARDDDQVALEITLSARPSVIERMRTAAHGSGAGLGEWLVELARQQLARESEGQEDERQQKLPF